MLWFGVKKNPELDQILLALKNDAENNYKDAAQANFRKFCNRFEALKNDGKLNAKQAAHYTGQKDLWEQQMKHYSHKEQKVTWEKGDK